MHFTICFDKPDNAYYLFNKRVCRKLIPTVLGKIEVIVSASEEISHVEFYLNDDLKSITYSDSNSFSWWWNKKDPLKIINDLCIVAYGLEGGVVQDCIIIKRIA